MLTSSEASRKADWLATSSLCKPFGKREQLGYGKDEFTDREPAGPQTLWLRAGRPPTRAQASPQVPTPSRAPGRAAAQSDQPRAQGVVRRSASWPPTVLTTRSAMYFFLRSAIRLSGWIAGCSAKPPG